MSKDNIKFLKKIPDEFFQGTVALEKTNAFIKPWRLPFDQLKLFPPEDGLPNRAEMTAGIRLRFRTDSKIIFLEIEPLNQDRTFDLIVSGKIVSSVCKAGDSSIIFHIDGQGEKIIEIWFTQDAPVIIKSLGISTKSKIKAVKDSRLKWITYGSSITHCRTITDPSKTWPAIVARKCDLNLTCLGFGGSCFLEPMVARVIRDLEADFISLKLGINIQGRQAMIERTFLSAIIGFVKIIRDIHKNIPIFVISPIISPSRETAIEPTGIYLKQMRSVVEEAVDRLITCGDKNLYYFNGLTLFGQEHLEYLPDGLHPNAKGCEIISDNFVKCVSQHFDLIRK